LLWPCAKAAEPTQVASLELVYRTVVLPRGVLGEAYRTRQIVRGGTAPYTVQITEGELPQGLTLSSDGQLSGTPQRAGSQRFTLRILDAAAPPVVIEQRYSIGIDAARPASAPPTPPRAPEPALPPEEPSQFISYRLTVADLEELLEARAPRAPADTESEDPFSPPPPKPKSIGPEPAQLEAMLTPLLDIGYPTRELFVAAIEAQRCGLYRSLLAKGELRATRFTLDCPERDILRLPDQGPVKPAGSDAKYSQLLPPALIDAIVALAEKRFVSERALSVRWRGDDCGCAPKQTANQVYGIYPYWTAQAEPQPVDFSQLTRISYAGASLSASGEYVLPAHWNDQSRDFVSRAHRHGTKVDLLIMRRDWQRLLRLSDQQQEEFAERAATNAVALLDTPLNDAFSRIKPYVLPFWNSSQYLYDGITVFFDDSTVTDPVRFKVLLQRFMQQLIEQLQRSGRSYALNIVVPDQRIGRPGAFDVAELRNYIESAEPVKRQVQDSESLSFRGTTDITVRFLVLLSEPTSLNNKLLRARLDGTDELRGHARIEVLERIVPLLFHANGETVGPMDLQSAERLDNDFAYIQWQFGGVGLWPLPIRTLGSGFDVIERLRQTYYPTSGLAPGEAVCRWICPNHEPLRLLLEVLLLTGAVSLALYFWSWPVRRLGRTYVLYLWIGAAITLLLALFLLRCDPDAVELREGNNLLYVLLALSVLAGAYITLRPRVPVP
jgi:hypothetical protein